MNTDQIYSLVNEVTAEALGANAITAVDGASLVALGNTVLSSSTNTEAFLNTLIQRIGKTIYSYRAYRNKLADYLVTDFEWGAIVQKIKVRLIDAESDPSYSLTDGSSVDDWTVRKPDVSQKLFVKRTPYMFAITRQDSELEEAFTSAESMGSFVSMITGEVRNSIELALENLGRTCRNNFIAEISGSSSRNIPLITNYNADYGASLTAATAYTDADFLRYTAMQIQLYSDYFTDMSSLFNDGTETRFTPKDRQRLEVYSLFDKAMRTNVEYAAYNPEALSIGKYSTVNFWQDAQSGSKADIQVTRASDSVSTTVSDVVAILADKEAFGMYQKKERVTTSPMNGAGLYYNTYWHEKELWFNDVSENGVIFTLT